MTDATFPKRVSFVYLDDIKQRFLEKYSSEQRNNAISYGLSSTFSEVLKTKMVFLHNT
jgi:hypothetical protein